MATDNKTDIWVFAHWRGMKEPRCIGILSAHQAKGRKAFSFEYDLDWIQSNEQLLLDPDIGWYTGPQFPEGKENFGMFLDSMPDRWGRTLMKRRAVQKARAKNQRPPILYDIDFLLGVHDESRMGALRFKLEKEGPFLDNEETFPTPPWSSIRELQYAASIIESDENNEEVRKWLAMLIAPGSSLGGARPKANILDPRGKPIIAKFPAKNDTIDKGAWECLAYQLAQEAGIEVSEFQIKKIAGNHHTFFVNRFDRLNGERIHFASAMTMTGKNEEMIKDNPGSYLDLAEFIQFSGTKVEAGLKQLWRRLVFNIAISNTDDHLRNHGFILTDEGWVISPAYDINPSIDKEGLALNIDMDDNTLDFELAKSVGIFFGLNSKQMTDILEEVKSSVKTWRKKAEQLGISKKEQDLMEPAFWRNN